MDDLTSPHATPALAVEPSPLLQNLLVFGRLLRAMGLRVTSRQLIEVANSLAFIDIGSKEDFRNTARCIMVSKHEDIPLFDFAFDIFWRAWTRHNPDEPLSKLMSDIARQVPRAQQAAAKHLPLRERSGQPRTNSIRPGRPGQDEAPEEEDNQSILALYSPGEVLREKDFSLLSREELADAKRFLSEMRWAITRRRSLRVRAARQGKRLDVRRSIRRSLRHGGELLDLAHRGPKLKRRPLVLLCDISGSMDRYTRLLLHFLHSVEFSVQRAEVFVFGTRLTRISRALRRRDPDEAIAAVASQVHDWSGGTRIGEALRTFNRRWARRVLGQGAIVLIISDGWDRGDPQILAEEMQRLQRQSYRLIWLNPLLGSENYEPLTQGIKAALPYVDDFLAIHNLASLEALGKLLNEIQEGRPARRQSLPRPGERSD